MTKLGSNILMILHFLDSMWKYELVPQIRSEWQSSTFSNHINADTPLSKCPPSLRLKWTGNSCPVTGLEAYLGFILLGLGLACLNTRLMTCVSLGGRCSWVLSLDAQFGRSLFQPWPAPARSTFPLSYRAPSSFRKISLMLTRNQKLQWHLHKKNRLERRTSPTWNTVVAPRAIASLAGTRLGPWGAPSTILPGYLRSMENKHLCDRRLCSLSFHPHPDTREQVDMLSPKWKQILEYLDQTFDIKSACLIFRTCSFLSQRRGGQANPEAKGQKETQD